MLILPPGHAAQLRARRPLSKRERWMIGGVLAALAALALGLVIALAMPGPKSGRGCIYATVPGPIGAQYVYECGGNARAICQAISTRGSFSAQASAVLTPECRKAGLPIR